MDDRRYATIVAIMLGVLTALVALLAILILHRSDQGTAATTTVAESSTTTTSSTTSTSTTTSTTTTTLAPTTTLTPFIGDLEDKACDTTGSPAAGTITAVRFGQHPGFTRVVFDFDGVPPACFASYAAADRLVVTIWSLGFPPSGAGVFDPSGVKLVDSVSVDRITDLGMGGGSGEWTYGIDLKTPDRPFEVFTLNGPSRLVIDIAD